jgi:hypothetical protein
MKKLLLVVLAVVIYSGLQAQVYQLPIDSVQYIRPDSLLNGWSKSKRIGDTVKVQGVVRFNPRNHMLASGGAWKATFIEDTAAGTWKGLNVRLASVADSTTTRFFDNMVPGNYVEVQGVVDDFGNTITGETQINLTPTVATRVLGFATPRPARPVGIDQFMRRDSLGNNRIQYPTGEQYEGMYVQFNNVTITDVSTFSGGTRIDWSIQDAQGNKIKIRDLSSFFRGAANISSSASTPPNPNAPVFVQQGKVYAYVRGTIVETILGGVPNYQLAPLDSSDLGPLLASPPFVAVPTVNPVVPTSSQSVTISANISDIDGTVSSATLFYATGAAPLTFTSVPMALNAGLWTATVPAQANGSKVSFYIRATDNSGSVTNSPDTLATNSFYLVRDAGINSISFIQTNALPNGNSIFAGKYIASNMSIRAVVTSTTANNDLGLVTLQEGSAPNAGIFAGRGLIDNAQRGDSVLITAARILETNGVTSLDSPTFTIVSRGNRLPAALPLVIDSVVNRNNAYLEQFEGMLMGVNNVIVASENPDSPANFGEFLVAKAIPSTTGLRIDDVSNDIPANFNTDSVSLGQNLAYVQGIFTFGFGNWKLMPRNRSDIFGFVTPNAVQIKTADSKMSLYPNPNNGSFTLQVDGLGMGTLSICDLQGKVLVSKMVVANALQEINANLQAGLYLVRWENNGRVSTQKMLVK